jgi:uncharacterized membrane protein
MDQNTISEGKTAAIISYIFTPIGLLVAYIINNDKKNAFAQFHIGQSVRLAILGAANYALDRILPHSMDFISNLISLGIFVLMIVGIINAANGKLQKLPIIGAIGE